jgi:hypothetical protein
MVPVYEPPAASPALRLTSQLGALCHHWEYAYRVAWEAAGLSLWEVCSLGDGPVRRAIEEESNRIHEPLYEALSMPERFELLAGLGALPG